MTRRKREGVVRYVEREATQSGGKITVTVGVYQQPLGKHFGKAHEFGIETLLVVNGVMQID